MRLSLPRVLTFLFLGIAVLAVGVPLLQRLVLDQAFGVPHARDIVGARADEVGVARWSQVRTLIDHRCVVCHACFDAPCQVNLTAPEGIARGASKATVYDALRLVAAEPTRLFVDAQSTAQWREKGFFPVLSERESARDANLKGGLMARMLALKRAHPAYDGMDFESDDTHESAQCPHIEEFAAFADANPERGMPYGLPALAEAEYGVIRDWLADGAPMPANPTLPPSVRDRVSAWEAFFNAATPKARLTSRYLYEHLFLANLYFDDLRPGHWFRLVRSRTPPGQPIDLIATRRPFDDPGASMFYYRLQPVKQTLVAKTHMPYALNQVRMDKWRRWFLDSHWTASGVSDYSPEVASNPFLAFRAMPVTSRYRFLLDEAQFTIMGFIKGPVCRGQVALNVIDDRFWVFFADPDSPLVRSEEAFLDRQAMNLRLPAENESTAAVLINWLKYSELQKDYLQAKSKWLENHFERQGPVDLHIIWDGDGDNPNAALTIFRHFDSATVTRGLVGSEPKTLWIIGYALLERIHYLLVAGFDVYGNVGHQLSTRLYMDFLRMEGEQNFLGLLPPKVRMRERDHWYRGGSEQARKYVYGAYFSANVPSAIQFKTNDPKAELIQRLRSRVAGALDTSAVLDGSNAAEASLAKLGGIRGMPASYLPEVSVLAVDDEKGTALYTLAVDRGFSSISHLTDEENYRIPEEDGLTLAYGVATAYPSAFFKLKLADIDQFVADISRLGSKDDLPGLVARYGITRRDARFWAFSDSVAQLYTGRFPVEAAVLDYNRLQY